MRGVPATARIFCFCILCFVNFLSSFNLSPTFSGVCLPLSPVLLNEIPLIGLPDTKAAQSNVIDSTSAPSSVAYKPPFWVSAFRHFSLPLSRVVIP